MRTVVQQTLTFDSIELDCATWTLVRHVLKYNITSTVELDSGVHHIRRSAIQNKIKGETLTIQYETPPAF